MNYIPPVIYYVASWKIHQRCRFLARKIIEPNGGLSNCNVWLPEGIHCIHRIFPICSEYIVYPDSLLLIPPWYSHYIPITRGSFILGWRDSVPHSHYILPLCCHYIPNGWLVNRIYQWPFQDPKLEVPTIYKAYKAYVREYPHKIWPYMVQYLHFRILEFPLSLVNSHVRIQEGRPGHYLPTNQLTPTGSGDHPQISQISHISQIQALL
jgi:hypothetical protein